MSKIESINLSLSSLCSAKCVFCPHKERGSKVRTKIMSLDTVKNIVKQIKDNELFFSELKKIEIGEAGDCFLNKDMIDILRLIRKELPKLFINVFTNFNGFTKDKSEIILKERLIDGLWMNLDSMKPNKYYATKGLKLERVLKNVSDFCENRKKHNHLLCLYILVLPIDHYTDLVNEHLEISPVNVKKGLKFERETYKDILDGIAKIVKIHYRVCLSPVIYWAERKQFKNKKIDYTGYSCPQLRRIEKELFVSPSGETYLCCLDNRFDLQTGNVIKTSIREVWEGDKRKDLIVALEDKKFKKIGYPCSTVNLCITQ